MVRSTARVSAASNSMRPYRATASRAPSGEYAAEVIASRGARVGAIVGVTSNVGSAAAPSGPGAPPSIQARMSAMSAGLGCVLSDGGIAGLASPVTIRIKRLCAARPGTIACPRDPPRSAAS